MTPTVTGDFHADLDRWGKAITDYESLHKKRVENMANEAFAELKRETVWAKRTAESTNEQADALEAEAERLEQLLGQVAEATHLERRSQSTSDLNRLQVDNSESALTPARRKETLQRLMNEVKNGGGRNRVAPDRSPPQQILLRAFAREEGHVF